MKFPLKTLMEGALDCVFPPLCYSCFAHLETPISHEESQQLNVCAKCAAAIKIHSSLFCSVCKSRIPMSSSLSLSLSPACHPKAGFLLAACSDLDAPAVRELIHTLKYRKIENAIHPIAELLIKPYIQNVLRNLELEIRNLIIIPVPLHKKKLRERGFNQSELIARALCSVLTTYNLQLSTKNLLIRVRATESQAETKSREARLENVQNCFAINPFVLSTFNLCPFGTSPAGRQLTTCVLVDDVLTSGATMREAVKTLKQAGAKHVLAFVLAKA